MVRADRPHRHLWRCASLPASRARLGTSQPEGCRSSAFTARIRTASTPCRCSRHGGAGLRRPRLGLGTSMDQHSFDRLTRAAATGGTRRAFVRRLVGSVAAIGLARGPVESATAARLPTVPGPSSTLPLREPSEPTPSAGPAQRQPETCPEPLVLTDCGCLDSATQTCCQDDVCTGVCTAKDGCCNVSADTTLSSRGEVCDDHCCHPHLDPADPGYSECCAGSCCAGRCYDEDRCCPTSRFCPGTVTDLCCAEGERCCGAGTAANVCIPGGAGACCAQSDCDAAPNACSVSCESGFCRQHICNSGAVCCPTASGDLACITGNCCNDASCGIGEACLNGYCTPVECFGDTDCSSADPCIVGSCVAGACTFAPRCAGECATCRDGICSTDDTLCGPCATCTAGLCAPVVCPDGFTCYAETGECLGIA